MLLKSLVIACLLYLVWRLLRGPLTASKRAVSPSHDPPKNLDPHDILGVPAGASAEEIRNAYQQKIQQYHPDKVADMGDELREVAERRTKELNEAYAKLRNR